MDVKPWTHDSVPVSSVLNPNTTLFRPVENKNKLYQPVSFAAQSKCNSVPEHSSNDTVCYSQANEETGI